MPSSVVTCTNTQNVPPIPVGGTVANVSIDESNTPAT
jgi:hypothetical protein